MLKSIIPKGENQYIEFKSENIKATELASEIVAFANSEGGEIWLGVEDDGAISGLSRSYEEDVMNICRTSCIPSIISVYESITFDDKLIARLIIPKGKDKPYYTKEYKYFVRVGSTKRIASREELMRLFQAGGAIQYDGVEIDKGRLIDLNIYQVGDYFGRYHISFLDEPEGERIRLMRHTDILGDSDKPTIAGLLVFGLAPERLLPPSGISYACFAGSEITAELIDKKNFFGPLPQQVNECLSSIKANIIVGSTIVGAKRVEAPHYPDRVFRELLVNACIHRNYALHGANIRILLFTDRLEVISPGRLPNTVSIDKLSVGTSFARNQTLVRFMENLGFVDKLGRGLPMVCQEARKFNLHVEFIESGEEFKVILPLPDSSLKNMLA